MVFHAKGVPISREWFFVRLKKHFFSPVVVAKSSAQWRNSHLKTKWKHAETSGFLSIWRTDVVKTRKATCQANSPLCLHTFRTSAPNRLSVRSERQPHTWNKRSKRHRASFARLAYFHQRPPSDRNNAFSQGVLWHSDKNGILAWI